MKEKKRKEKDLVSRKSREQEIDSDRNIVLNNILS